LSLFIGISLSLPALLGKVNLTHPSSGINGDARQCPYQGAEADRSDRIRGDRQVMPRTPLSGAWVHGRAFWSVDRIDVSNWRRIGLPEYELVEDMIRCANFLANEEDLRW